ncbi:MAG: sugar phosphate isomerase/epimerase [Victivallaceae bacterium]|nr:sugar phosphate isomerase/epimerase [Victivallaceae bacterium]
MNIAMMSLMMRGHNIREIVSVASQCKMEAIDWIGLHRSTAKELKKASDDAGIKIAAHTLFRDEAVAGFPEDMDFFRKTLDDACEMEAPILMVPPFATPDQKSPADDRKRFIDFYGKAYEWSKKTPVQLTMESTGFLKSPITTAKECLEVLCAVPGLKLTFDIGNAATAEDPCESFLQVREYVVYFHFKDWHISETARPGYDLKRNGKYMTECFIGDGQMPLKKFRSLLTEKEKHLPVNPESCDYSGKMAPVAAFKEICARLRSL